MKIYFDMDGVLADFERGVRELCGIEPPDQNGEWHRGRDDDMWARIKEVEHFYDKLELVRGAKELFNAVYGKYGKDCEILTGIPKPKRGILTAGDDKIKWMHRLLSEDIKVNIVYSEENHKFCTGKDCILIDDMDRNIRDWEKNGGTGILHRNAEETLQALKERGIL